MTYIDLIGSSAAVLTTIAFMPQALKVILTKDTRALSLMMYLILTTGVALWLTYGYLKGDVPITVANAITLIFSGIILAMKLKNLKKDREG